MTPMQLRGSTRQLVQPTVTLTLRLDYALSSDTRRGHFDRRIDGLKVLLFCPPPRGDLTTAHQARSAEQQ